MNNHAFLYRHFRRASSRWALAALLAVLFAAQANADIRLDRGAVYQLLGDTLAVRLEGVRNDAPQPREAVVELQGAGADGQFRHILAMEALMLAPGSSDHELLLPIIAPEPGVYTVRLRLHADGRELDAQLLSQPLIWRATRGALSGTTGAARGGDGWLLLADAIEPRAELPVSMRLELHGRRTLQDLAPTVVAAAALPADAVANADKLRLKAPDLLGESLPVLSLALVDAVSGEVLDERLLRVGGDAERTETVTAPAMASSQGLQAAQSRHTEPCCIGFAGHASYVRHPRTIYLEIDEIHNDRPYGRSGTLFVDLWARTHPRTYDYEYYWLGGVELGELEAGQYWQGLYLQIPIDLPPTGSYWITAALLEYPDQLTPVDELHFQAAEYFERYEHGRGRKGKGGGGSFGWLSVSLLGAAVWWARRRQVVG